jgi:hypothetical protein
MCVRRQNVSPDLDCQGKVQPGFYVTETLFSYSGGAMDFKNYWERFGIHSL